MGGWCVDKGSQWELLISEVIGVDRDTTLVLSLGQTFCFVVLLSMVVVFGLAGCGVHVTLVVRSELQPYCTQNSAFYKKIWYAFGVLSKKRASLAALSPTQGGRRRVLNDALKILFCSFENFNHFHT
jgi:hypothetical protein